MAAKIHGRVGAADLAATTNTGVYTVPATRKGTLTVIACNRNATAVRVRLAYIDGALGALANEDYIEYDTLVPGNTPLTVTGLPITATHTLMAYASTTGVSVGVFAVEEDAS